MGDHLEVTDELPTETGEEGPLPLAAVPTDTLAPGTETLGSN